VCKRAARKEYKSRYYRENKEHIDAQVEAWKAEHPDAVDRYRRASWENLKADPERYEERLVANRISRRLSGATRGERLHQARAGGYVPLPRGNHSGCQLPTEPLREWLLSAFKGWLITEIADYVGVDDSHLGKIISGKQQLVSEYVADKIFVGADCTYMLALLYPVEEAA